MTHRLKAFTLDAGLRMSLGDSRIAAQVLMTCVDSFLDCALLRITYDSILGHFVTQS
jgi:hypothetical protein